jgi:hypothetical protein
MMSYIELNKRQKTGALNRCAVGVEKESKKRVFVNLIKLDKPYKNIAYSINENTSSPFISCGLYKDLDAAIEAFCVKAQNLKDTADDFEIIIVSK